MAENPEERLNVLLRLIRLSRNPDALDILIDVAEAVDEDFKTPNDPIDMHRTLGALRIHFHTSFRKEHGTAAPQQSEQPDAPIRPPQPESMRGMVEELARSLDALKNLSELPWDDTPEMATGPDVDAEGPVEVTAQECMEPFLEQDDIGSMKTNMEAEILSWAREQIGQTRDACLTTRDRAGRDPEFRSALLQEVIDLARSGDDDVASALLRDIPLPQDDAFASRLLEAGYTALAVLAPVANTSAMDDIGIARVLMVCDHAPAADRLDLATRVLAWEVGFDFGATETEMRDAVACVLDSAYPSTLAPHP